MKLRIELSRLDLDATKPLRRDPPRPPEHRQPGYEAAFDFLTVLYDCFVAPNGRDIICIGPPLLNLEPSVAPAINRAFRRLFLPRFEVRSRDRNDQIWLRPRAWTATFDGGLFEQRTIRAQPNYCGLFRGRRVLVTRSKDNELVWIRDWVRFHAVNHGCDAVLFYDNSSSKYGLAEIHQAISTVPGIDVPLVIGWPFKFGPGAGPSGLWDSDFTSYAILEHARQRFLAAADVVINADVDELVVTENRESVFELAKTSQTGYLEYPGLMIENVADPNVGSMRLDANFAFHKRPPRQATRKWTVAPARCDAQSQWCVHEVTDMEADQQASARVSHRHFAAITTGWKYPISAPNPPGEDDVVDEELRWVMRCLADEREQPVRESRAAASPT